MRAAYIRNGARRNTSDLQFNFNQSTIAFLVFTRFGEIVPVINNFTFHERPLSGPTQPRAIKQVTQLTMVGKPRRTRILRHNLQVFHMSLWKINDFIPHLRKVLLLNRLLCTKPGRVYRSCQRHCAMTIMLRPRGDYLFFYSFLDRFWDSFTLMRFRRLMIWTIITFFIVTAVIIAVAVLTRGIDQSTFF